MKKEQIKITTSKAIILSIIIGVIMTPILMQISIPLLILLIVASIATMTLLLFTIAHGLTEQQEKGWKDESSKALLKVLAHIVASADILTTLTILVISTKIISWITRLPTTNTALITSIVTVLLLTFVLAQRIVKKTKTRTL